MVRNPKGSVAIADVDGRLRLRWLWRGKQETLSAGPADDRAVMVLAQKLA